MQNGFKTYCPHQSINKRWFCNIEFYSRENLYCLHCPSKMYYLTLQGKMRKNWSISAPLINSGTLRFIISVKYV